MEQTKSHSKNLDIHCLRCGAYNIAENHICGRCGASLPLVYDDEGRVLSLRHRAMMRERAGSRPGGRAANMRWFLRFGLVLFALYVAYLIIRGRH